ncbi:phosphonate ABC transporter substrate-binding protein [Oceanimonas baumannii]|uniref:Phosphonate ABC transporter substrate-binding protein n=1 Tax=Oceanimonas baumannii TaxID=129578 RepID=A0A235CHF2_9GAMM|nr:phosphonate ABC transporter substrate-binding protein [Oceanimonas baumannii]OYD23275.1 phosphonate ABC transporter substrate-binding protein [Oceanimonas baumannii]TDW58581.1 phosphonate transport system substrate-binding protein [Oceanimonas baumannii]
MMHTLKKFVGGAALLSAAVTTSVVADEQALSTINFGIISTESQQNLKQSWEPFLADMEKQLGIEVEAFFAPDYAGIIQGMRFDKVDIAWLGNKSAMEAVDRAGGEIFAQTVSADGQPGYWSLLIAHKDSELASVDDVLAQRKELIFGNGDPNSTSGFLVPSYYVFAQKDVSSQEFKRTLNSSHEVNLFAVLNKQVDVATNNTESLARFAAREPEKAKNIKVLWKSPLIPADPIVWRENLPEATKQMVYDFFMNYSQSASPEQKEILAALDWDGFKASSNLQLLPIRQLQLFKDLKERENNNADANEIAQIKQQLAALNRQMSALDAMTN